nr:baseplate J/gp47 family protein [Elusimicrobiaceae bacterium]
MAIEEEVFINSMGEEVSITNLVNEMINYYALKVGVGESKVTDFNEGSEIRNLLESFAVDLYVLLLNQEQLTQICFVETAEGEWLDKHGANPFVQLPREAGSVASGFITFTIPYALTSELNIPAGTVVASSETGLEYETLSDVILGIGETSVTSSIESLTIGEDCNAGVGDIDTLVSDIGVNGVTVTNEDPVSGGVDYEEDDEYRNRLLSYIRKDDFGSIGYYTTLCEAVNGVHDVSLIDATGYTKKVLVNGDVKPTSDTVLLEVLGVLTSTDNLVLGHSFIVDKPDYVTKNLTV